MRKRMPLFEDIFRRAEPQPGMTPLTPGVGGVPESVQQPGSLFSPDDIRSAARANALLQFGSSLLESSGTGRPVGTTPSFASALGSAARAAGAGYDTGMQQAGAQRAAALRASIMQRYPETPGETSDQTIRRLEKIFAALVAGGDTEGAGKIGEVLKSYGGARAGAKPTGEWEDFGGEKWLVDPITRRPILDANGNPTIQKKTPGPRDPNAPSTAEELRLSRQFDRTNRLMDDFRSETKLISQAANQVRTLIAVAPAALAGDARAQISLVFAFMKSLDPSSVVREAEYATAANAAGVPERVRNQYNKLIDGGFLTPEQVKSFVERGKDAAAGWKREQDALIEDYNERAKRWNIDVRDVTRDYFKSVGTFNSGAAAATPAAAPSVFDQLDGLFPPKKPNTP